MRIAIMGATGHVGRVLTWQLSGRPGVELLLLARSPERAQAFASEYATGPWRALDIDELAWTKADALIDCVGIGDPGALHAGVTELEAVFDEAFTDWLARHPDAQGIALSSGVVYDTDFARPAGDATPLRIPDREQADPGEAYALAKARSESAHREADLPIVDLRLFGFFSRFLQEGTGFLMGDVIRAIRTGRELVVGVADVNRDYVAPADLAALVVAVLEGGPRNRAYDVVSAAPVRLSALLAHFAHTYGLSYTVGEPGTDSPTGTKPEYFSTSRRAHEELGYRPRLTSLQALDEEAAAVLTAPDREEAT